MYLLSVLSSDRTAEITFLLSLNSSYSTLPSSLPSIAVSNIHRTALAHHTHRFHSPTYAGLITSLTAEVYPTQPKSITTSQGKDGTLSSKTNSQTKASSQTQNQQQSNPQGQGQNQEDSGTLRSQYGRFLPPPPTSPPSRHAYLSTLEEVLGKYYNVEKAAGRLQQGQTQKEEVEWVYLATPFVCCYARPVAVFLAFQKLMERISQSPLSLKT
jgi:glucan-binding YG repeat protein